MRDAYEQCEKKKPQITHVIKTNYVFDFYNLLISMIIEIGEDFDILNEESRPQMVRDFPSIQFAPA